MGGPRLRGGGVSPRSGGVRVELRCRPDLFSSEYASSPTSVGIGTFDVGCSLLGDLRFGRRSVRPSGHLGTDDPAHWPFRGWEGYPVEAPPMPKCFIPVGGELVRTPDLTLVVPQGTTRSYGGRAGAIVWDEGVARHTTLMAHGGAGQYSRSPCRGARIVLSEPMNAAVLGGAVPVPSFQAARKEWRAVTEHSFRSSGGEVRSKGASFLDKRIAVCICTQIFVFCRNKCVLNRANQPREQYMRLIFFSGNTCCVKVQEGTSLLDVDPCSVTTEGVGELNDDILQQKLQEITRHRERLQQMEIELRARAIARSDILEVQNSFEGQLKEQIDFNANLKVPTCLVLSDNINKEQLHEREQHILELEMKLEEKDRELHAMKIDTEAVFSLGNELLTSIKYGQLNVQLFVEMEHYHMQAIQQLQLELAEARGNNRMYKDGLQVTHENSVDSSSYDGNQINVKDDGKSDAHLGFTSNGSVDMTMPHDSASNSSTKVG
ncbi:hypothetical protein B296_00011699 [Ensete ventricosum]|uniref:Uncharacterized protein n=1 Tax=Ensete ventricosum TaxID=4639 RepID=A0A426ZL79_ENSVE|nr:hypothetical protein B296_00011699 [Ensete ventricosum]